MLRAEGAMLELEFDRPQWAVTPGQSVVVYISDVCLGGGIVNARSPEDETVDL